MNKFKEIVDEANLIFNNEYNYIELFKKNNIKFLKIECKNHGLFEKNIYNHIKNKQGCPQCSKPAKLTKELFIEKSISIHGKIYDYSNVIYNHGKDKVQIKCIKHGIFEMIPINHLKGQKCPTCSGRNKVTNELFIEKTQKIHGDKYDYSKSKYSGTRKNIIITCKEHGVFIQKPNDHLSGNGCQKCCLGRFSKISIEWLDNIMKKENIFIQHAGNIGEKEIIIDNKKIRFDGFCEENNTVFEFYGDFFHGNPELYRENDINPINKKSYGELYINTIQREEHIKNAGYNLIKILENDYCKNKKD